MENKFHKNKESTAGLFFQLFMSNQKNLYAFILASVHNYSDAEDILQDTATVMWQKFDEFDRDSSFVAWGIAISRNLIKKYYSRRQRTRIQFDSELSQKISDAMENRFSEMDIRQEALRICSQKLHHLSRSLLEMRYSRGMTVKAIANQLNRSIHGMYKTIARVQDALQECVQKEIKKMDH